MHTAYVSFEGGLYAELTAADENGDTRLTVKELRARVQGYDDEVVSLAARIPPGPCAIGNIVGNIIVRQQERSHENDAQLDAFITRNSSRSGTFDVRKRHPHRTDLGLAYAIAACTCVYQQNDRAGM